MKINSCLLGLERSVQWHFAYFIDEFLLDNHLRCKWSIFQQLKLTVVLAMVQNLYFLSISHPNKSLFQLFTKRYESLFIFSMQLVELAFLFICHIKVRLLLILQIFRQFLLHVLLFFSHLLFYLFDLFLLFSHYFLRKHLLHSSSFGLNPISMHLVKHLSVGSDESVVLNLLHG